MTEAHLTVSDTLNATWKNDKKGFGFRMLQKMGWKEETGLGKDESGITKHIHVKKRENGLGLGMEHVKDDAIGSKGWSATLTSFNGVLDLLKTNYSEMGSSADSDKEKKPKKRKRDKRDSDEVSSEENNKKKKLKKEKADKKPKKEKPIIATKIRFVHDLLFLDLF
jgi:alpha-galactosidase/6-phospho-beta-glucosidase family protein